MKASIACISCLVEKHAKKLREYQDDEKSKAYFAEFLALLHEHGMERSSPWLQNEALKLREKYFGPKTDYQALKSGYDQYMLSKESLIEEKIRSSADPIAECIKYACAGNYIDTTSVENISEEVLENLLKRVESDTVDPVTLERFRKDLSGAREMVYITDNCGEIVLDKIFIRHIMETWPAVRITVLLRGALAENDATMEDADEVGLTEITDCIGNGSSITGTDLTDISPEALSLLQNADVILAKGQGNFETLHACKLNPYYLFLCKCDFFTRTFSMERFASVFTREDQTPGNILS